MLKALHTIVIIFGENVQKIVTLQQTVSREELLHVTLTVNI